MNKKIISNIKKIKEITFLPLNTCIKYYKQYNYDFNKTIIKLKEILQNKKINGKKINNNKIEQYAVKYSIDNNNILLKLIIILQTNDDIIFNIKEVNNIINNKLIDQKILINNKIIEEIEKDKILYIDNFYDNNKYKIIEDIILKKIKIELEKISIKYKQIININKIYFLLKKKNVNNFFLHQYIHYDKKNIIILLSSSNLEKKYFIKIAEICLLNDIMYLNGREIEDQKKIEIIQNLCKKYNIKIKKNHDNNKKYILNFDNKYIKEKLIQFELENILLKQKINESLTIEQGCKKYNFKIIKYLYIKI